MPTTVQIHGSTEVSWERMVFASFQAYYLVLKHFFSKVRSELLVPVSNSLYKTFARMYSEGELSGFNSTTPGFCESPFTSVGVIEIC